jgi:hypothetical protein
MKKDRAMPVWFFVMMLGVIGAVALVSYAFDVTTPDVESACVPVQSPADVVCEGLGYPVGVVDEDTGRVYCVVFGDEPRLDRVTGIE